ncbi:hypothetical protein [Paracoccus sp. (in: a-proteobacteria)]|uniref:hypothetical protein n=1 Tax=Paracoccus sp. TaxID=267 RepID=UPI0028A5CA66|nr:hypothetical protein [Paracoccus sp. (in: a-proteobacteria)]
MSEQSKQSSHLTLMPQMEADLARKGETVAALCRQAGVAATTWGRWKRGSVSPNLKTWEAVFSAYRKLMNQTSEGAA